MKSGALESLKFKKLKRRLKLNQWQAAGLLESLWQFTASNAPQGDIGKHSNEDIAATIEWDDDADTLIQELSLCGWLDESEDHRLLVHDWHQHAPNYVKGGLAKAKKQFLTKLKPKDEPKEQAKDEPRDTPKEQAKDEPKDIPTKPNLTTPSLTQPRQTVSRDRDTGESADTDHGMNIIILHKPEQASKVKLDGFDSFTKFDVTSIACTICHEFKGPGIGAFSKWLKCYASAVGDEKACNTVREELFTFWSELRAGEEPRSRGAALLARCRKIFDERKG